LSIQADGKVLLTGRFTTLQPNGSSTAIPRHGVARLLNDDATQILSVADETQVLWQRGGSAPELSSVAFDAPACRFPATAPSAPSARQPAALAPVSGVTEAPD